MKRTLSSRYTRLDKVFTPLAPAGMIVILLLCIIGGSLPLYPIEVIALALPLALLVIFGWPYARLCYVGVDESNLYVSRGTREGVIPLASVDEVHFKSGFNLAVIRLKSKSDFGDKILFLPPLIPRQYRQRTHPVVNELQALVKKAQAASVTTT